MLQAAEARKLTDQAKLIIVDEKMVKLEERIIELAGENQSVLNLYFPEPWRKPLILEKLREAGYAVKEYRFGNRARITW